MKNISTLSGHIACFTAYAIFGVNIIVCKDLTSGHLISPIAIFTLRSLGAGLMFWILSLFLPYEKVEKKDNAVSRLKDSKAKSKVVILLTDGSNNRGDISPLTAAEIAKTYGIRVYTIGVGSNGTAPYPYRTMGGVQYINVPVEIDESTLQQIAKTADGQYYRATSNSKLKEVYEEIDKLEKTKLNVKDFSRKSEEYMPFALWAMVCLLLEVLLRLTVLRRIP